MTEPFAVIEPDPLDRVVAFHGHLCPGLTMGMQAATLALAELGPRAILERDPRGLFAVAEVDEPPPSRARVHTSVTCAACDEPTMETRIRLLGGRELCPPCFDAEFAGS